MLMAGIGPASCARVAGVYVPRSPTAGVLHAGVNPGDIMGGGSSGNNASVQGNGADPQLQEQINSCTIAKANSDVVCRVVATSNSLNKVWPTLMNGYTRPALRIFNDNQVAYNGYSGVILQPGAAGNRFSGNRMHANGVFDLDLRDPSGMNPIDYDGPPIPPGPWRGR